MKTKKYNLVILLAMFLYTIGIALLLLYLENMNDCKPKYEDNNHSIITKNYNNEKVEISPLAELLLKKRLYHLDSIYSHANNLYNMQCDLYAKGQINEKVINVLAIEKEMALQAIKKYKKKLSNISNVYIR